MNSLRTLLCIALIALLPEPAAAQRIDPFLSETEGDGTFAEEVSAVKEAAVGSLQYTGARAELPAIEKKLQEQQRFSSSMEGLLRSAGVDPSNEASWANFEDAEGTDAEENYRSTDEWQMQQELAQPLPERAPFGSKLDYIEEKLKEFRSQDADAIEKEMRKYQKEQTDEEQYR